MAIYSNLFSLKLENIHSFFEFFKYSLTEVNN